MARWGSGSTTSRQSLQTGYHSAASDQPLTPEEHAAAARHAERVLLGMILAVVAFMIAVSMIRREDVGVRGGAEVRSVIEPLTSCV